MNTTQNKLDSNKIVEIIKEHKTKSNKDLTLAMDFIQKDFDLTKENIIKLTNHLDKLENSYNVLLKEYQSRNGNK
jgi:phage terminase Nu1 subunit (DNA packaging protein)